MGKGQVSIIEDDATISKSIQLYIESKSMLKVTSTFDSVESFLESDEDPSILFLDIGLPGMSGLEGLPIIKKKFPELDIIMLTTYEENEVIFEALCAGACSYISKRTPLPKIVEALEIVNNGGSYMSPSIAKKVTSFFIRKPVPQKVKLTDRQNEIIKHIIDGSSFSQIAAKCFISINTVRTHVKAIYKKLEISSKMDLMKKYMDGEI